VRGRQSWASAIVGGEWLAWQASRTAAAPRTWVAEPSICSSRRSSPLIRRPIGGPARCAAPLDAPPGRAADVTICAALGDSAWEAIPSELREILTAGDAAVLAEIRGRGLNLIDVPLVVGPERLARLTVPTLLVSGEDSIAACRFVNAQLTEAIPGAVSVGALARSTRIDEGATSRNPRDRCREPPSATSLEWIGKSNTGGWTACHTHDASTMSASPSRTSTR
jgi:pimeloyl-ACP methyl ester carboxylesterase